jgi:hypothetical protein
LEHDWRAGAVFQAQPAASRLIFDKGHRPEPQAEGKMAAAPRKSRLEALSEELRLFSPQAGEITDETALNEGFRGARLAALCLSGGGIRSASFCLGVIQALAEARLLAQFNYLSTVSGGGYIGSWLHKLINQEPSHDPKEVQGRLPSSDAITTLRNYTKYLSPESGLFSLDLWTNAVLWLRNTLLTWVVYLPLVALAITAAIFYRTFIWAAAGWPQPYLIAIALDRHRGGHAVCGHV